MAIQERLGTTLKINCYPWPFVGWFVKNPFYGRIVLNRNAIELAAQETAKYRRNKLERSRASLATFPATAKPTIGSRVGKTAVTQR
jgi:hypothetical protein